MKKIVHIIKDEKFTDGLITNYERIAPGRCIYLVLTKNRDGYTYVKSTLDQVLPLPTSEALSNLPDFSDCGMVIFHGLDRVRLKLLDAIPNKLKIIVHFWGADIYFLPQFFGLLLKPKTKQIYKSITPYYLRLKDRFRGYYFLYQYKRLLKKVNFYSTVIPTESAFIQSFMPKAKQIDFNYADIEGMNLEEHSLQQSPNGILIGNSSSYTCNHIDVIHAIEELEHTGSKKKIIPLNYGDRKYADRVSLHLRDFDDHNYEIITRFLTLKEFIEIVSQCVVALMYHQRQQAVGTIIICLWMGMKVFLSEMNPIYSYYKAMGIKVFSFENELELLNETNILPLEPQQILENRSILRSIYSKDRTLFQVESIVSLVEE